MRFALRAGALGFALALLAAGLFVPIPVEGRPGPPGTELPPPATGGITKLDPLLQKLTNNRRLLIVGAHPDDENSALLAVVSRKLGGEAAYLSLTRGEGGQNLIGDELGVGLGLIRTQELLAARRLDGARQFFTRAYDFGFSKSLDEALRFWPKRDLLEDAVRVVRRFRPQVLFVTFTGTPADGHGQHSASAVVAREAFQAAGDASAFPELSREGLPPWAPKTLLRSNWFDEEKKSFPISTGDVEPLTGKSYAQIAVASRSLHRSQGTGALQRPGPNETGAIWLDGTAGSGGQELFAGVDTRLRSIAADVTDAARRTKIETLLDGVQSSAEKLRARLSPATIRDAAAPLAGMLRDLRAARALSTSADAGAASVLDEKVAAAEAALAAAAEVTLDALAETETAVEGEAVPITASVWNAGGAPVEVASVALESPDGWTVSAATANTGKTVSAGKLEEWKLEARVPAGAAATIPYFLRRPLKDSLYDWTGVPESIKGEPFAPPAVTAVAVVRIGGESVRLSREVTLRIRDEVAGEIRHSLRAVPRLEVSVEPSSIVWPLERRRPRPITVTVSSNAKDAIAGNVEIVLPPRWPAIPPAAFSLAKKGDRAVIEISLLPPESLTTGKFDITVAAVVGGGGKFATSIAMIDYEHIRPTPQPKAAQIAFSAVDLKLPKLASVGYVRGAADRVPEALLGVGVPVRLLTDEDLERGDLSRYDAILIGSRAYETDPGLARANGRLLDAVRAGGLLIVQYQQYPFIQGGYAPYTLEIARPHDRVTDETAKVTILDPADPLWSTPNKIGPQDWDGWVQERGLYFAHTWAPEYTPMLAMNDPGAPEMKGSLLAARVGKGRYVYTGLAFFRQLPAGVPGAYRLIANLLGWK
ncbi:MAG TPA: PIG-L family deacetylase [Thermoanaerobaculia bacterium]